MNNTTTHTIPMKRFAIWIIDLPSSGNSHVQHGIRPAIIVSNDMANLYSPVVTVVPLTSRQKKPLPTHVSLRGCGLNRDSTALCEQIITVDKTRLTRCIGFVYNTCDQYALRQALRVQLGMVS